MLKKLPFANNGTINGSGGLALIEVPSGYQAVLEGVIVTFTTDSELTGPIVFDLENFQDSTQSIPVGGGTTISLSVMPTPTSPETVSYNFNGCLVSIPAIPLSEVIPNTTTAVSASVAPTGSDAPVVNISYWGYLEKM